MIRSQILDVSSPVVFDDSITSYEYHSYQPYASSGFKVNNEIRIPIHNQDALMHPCRSYLYVEGKVTSTANPALPLPATTTLGANAFAFLFTEMRYEINSVVVDSVRNPGIATVMKAYASYDPDEVKVKVEEVLDRATGEFTTIVPLDHLMGFFENYKRVLLNVRQELILVRANVNTNALKVAAADQNLTTLELTRIAWRMPHVTVSDGERLRFLETLNDDNWLSMGFMTWELHELPAVLPTKVHTWSVKTSAKLDTPRYVLFGFQTDRKGITKDAQDFDHCKLKDFRLYLNGIPYPYDNLNLDFDKGKYIVLYDMYARFQSSFYGTEDRPFLKFSKFKTDAPLVVIDCSHQMDTLRTGTVDVRIEWETKDDVEPDTSAYCLILHDKVVAYKPLTGLVQIQ